MPNNTPTRRGDFPLLVWTDVETTCLDEGATNAGIVEVAVVFTTPHLEELERASYLITDAPPPARWDPYVRAMHERTGLLEDLIKRSSTKHTYGTLIEVEEDIVQKLRSHKRADSQLDRHKPRIAGFSIGNFDFLWLKKFMPGFTQRLSHRVLDVGSIVGPIRWYDVDPLPHKDTAHRAAADCDEAIAAYKQCLTVLCADKVWERPALCFACGKPLSEHLDEHPPGAPVPRMMCLGLKAHFKVDTPATSANAETLQDMEASES